MSLHECNVITVASSVTVGVILPGDVLKFPFVFKSPNAGVFSEQWYFQTKPTLNTGSPLAVTLRGVALQEDKYAKQRTALEVRTYCVYACGYMRVFEHACRRVCGHICVCKHENMLVCLCVMCNV